jgi:hypothetical protein
MAIALVQSVKKDVTNVNNTTVSFTNNIGAGRLLTTHVVTYQGVAGTDISDPTSSLGNVGSAATTQQDDPGDFVHMRSYYVPNSIAGAETGTYDISGTGSGEITVIASEFSGLSTSAPLSGTPALSGPTTTAFPSTGNMTPGEDGCLIIAVLHAGGSANTITPPGSPWTLIQQYQGENNSVTLSVVYQIQTTAAAVSATWSLNYAATCLAHIMAFRPAQDAPPPGPGFLVQSAKKDTSGVNNTTLAFPSALTAGNVVVASNVQFQATAGTTVTTPTDTLLHTYLAATAQQNNAANTLHLRSFYVPNCTGGADTVTYDISGTGVGELTAIQAEFGMSSPSPALSGTPVLAGPTTTTSPTTGSMTPADDNCLIIAVLQADGIAVTITPPASPWVLVQQYEGANNTVTLSMIYQKQGTAAPVSATWTLSGSRVCISHIFAIKPSVVPSLGLLSGMMLQGYGR